MLLLQFVSILVLVSISIVLMICAKVIRRTSSDGLQYVAIVSFVPQNRMDIKERK